MEPTVFSYKKELNFDIPVDQEKLETLIDQFISELTFFLKKSGCRLIGHIKGMMEPIGQGYIAFSVTSFEEDIHYKGKIKGNITAANFLLNVIVYGVDEELIEKEVVCGLNSFLQYKR